MSRVRQLIKMSFANPIKVLSLGLALGVVSLPVLGSVEWEMYDSLIRVGMHELTLQRLAGTVAHLNEVLTMYARLAATTGDRSWEKRYNTVAPRLDSAIVGIAMEARAEYERNYVAQTKLAYGKLIEMESVAFALVRRGRREEAYQLLFSPRYDEQKALYSQGIKKMTKAVEKRIAAEVQSFRRRILWTGILIVGGLVVLLAVWIWVILVVNRNLGLRRFAEDALAREKEQLSVTLRSIGEGVITTDTNGRVNLMNRVAEELTGWSQEDAFGKPLDEVFVIINEVTREITPCTADKVLETGSICELTDSTVLISKDSAERIIADSGAPIRDRQGDIVGMVLAFRDITEQQHMLKEVHKAEKLESVGMLAGGIAHDFNNILTAVLGNLSLAKLDTDPDSRVFQRIAQAERASARAKDLTQQLLTFSKGGAPIKRVTSVKSLLPEWVEFALRGSNVKCVFRIQDRLWNAEIDESQVSQVLHRLIINADQAMPNGGEIRVSAENFLAKDGAGLPILPGEYVKISVQDEGIGVPAEHLQRIFDPYFTTKEYGIGLGLATSYATIKRHGGHLTVESSEGSGATFQIFLPASSDGAVLHFRPTLEPREGRGKILLMDDESVIRELATDMLTSLGYRVFTTRDGLETIRLYKIGRDSGEPFDAVIMDLTVKGGMGGREAIARLRDLDPEIRAIVSSGYCNDPVMGDFRKYGFSAVLAKPYTATEMSETLHALINCSSN
jgi:PAS domain S-box-containing protein